MRKRSSYVITLISDTSETQEVAGKLEIVNNGECYNFQSWDELKNILMKKVSEPANALFLASSEKVEGNQSGKE